MFLKSKFPLLLILPFLFTFSIAVNSAEGDDADVEEVVVTGSRIVDPNIISSSHISVIDGDAIKNRGITRVEDYLNDMPQISPGQSITNANGASGTATANLRNMGCGRTLVLLNGRRLAPGTTGGGNCADLNSIPSLLLERVEVLTGGASSVYGSDAVAGVVNFVLDDEFNGFKASASHSLYQHKNDNDSLRSLVSSYNYALAPDDITTGDTGKFAIAFGGDINNGKGHITAFIEHTDTQPILQGEYDISACALSGGASRCGGSSTIPPGRFADFGGLRGYTRVDGDPTVSLDLKVFGDQFVPRAGRLYNYNPTNFFQRPDDRINAGFFGKYEINEHAEVYTDVTFMKSESNAQIAYSGTFGNINAIPCYNAQMSQQQYDTICGDFVEIGGSYAPNFTSGSAALAYIAGLDQAVGAGTIDTYKSPMYHLKRNVEGNPRQSIYAYKQTNATLGLRGDINDNWSYDVYFQSSTINYSNEYRNDLSVTAINRAVDVVNINGTPTCVSAINGQDSACIPYNLFFGGSNLDDGLTAVVDAGQALQDYIAKPTFINGDGKQTIMSGYLQGDTGISFPGAPSNVSLVVGFETKELSADFRPDTASKTGDRSGSGGATLPIGGDYEVDEYYFELGIPITDSLSLDAGYRSGDYSTGADTEAFKIGAHWAVNDSIAIRASAQTAQRAGNIGELYSAVSDGLVDLDNDPCGTDPENGNPPTATAAQCANTGLSADLYGSDLKSPADQYNIKGGGNPNINPEESESFTAGIIITPNSVPGLTVTLDYFDITIEDGIGSVSAATALDNCISTGAASYCNLINRKPGNGSLWLTGGYISAQLTNISEESTSGFDIIFDYTTDTAWGALTLAGVTTVLDSYDVIELPGSTPLECAGNWGGSCGKNPMPELAGNYTATLNTSYDTDLIFGMRYLGETDDQNASYPRDFDAYTYFDFTANYFATDNLTVSFGMSNVFDKEPEYTSNAGTAPGNGNTFPAYFDALGRYMFLSLNYAVE